MATTTERRDVERLFNGEQLADGHVLTGVGAFLDTVGKAYGNHAAPAPRDDLAAVMNAGGTSAVRIGHDWRTRSGIVPMRSKPRRFRAVAAIAATVVVSVAATGGLAAASALPDPMQRAVADFADHFGVHLPRPNLPDFPNASGSDDARVSIGTTAEPESIAPTTATTTPSSSEPTPSAPTTAVADLPPVTVIAGLPSAALPAVPHLPSLPHAADLDPLLPECRGSWLLKAAHLCRDTGH